MVALGLLLVLLPGLLPAQEGLRGELAALRRRLARLEERSLPDWVERFTLGGYGEIHANFTAGGGPHQADIHRLVLYLGYEFADWIRFSSETELEHALVSREADGELSFEQLYVDFLLDEKINVRVGRILVPLGIVNQRHEPPTFHGVERPTFARVIIPTTWSADGVGVHGRPRPWLRYELYVVAGLDGSGFDARNGIRGGRLEERPGLGEPAYTGRLDLHPFLDTPWGASLRLGLAFYGGGLDNGNRGKRPGVNADLAIYAADLEYRYGAFELRGAGALERIRNAGTLPGNTAAALAGYYIETAVHVWPASLRQGRLRDTDLALFVRYERLNTQFHMPSDRRRDPAGDRHEWTVGLTFFLTPTFVLKADYGLRRDAAPGNPRDVFNLGVGWAF